ARDGDLEELDVLGSERLPLQHGLEGPEPDVDPLGVVEPVDPEDEALRIAPLTSQAVGDAMHFLLGGETLERGDVDPDGSPIDADVTSVVTQPSPVRAADTAIAPGGGGKVLGVLAGLEGDHVGAEEAFHDRGSPWEPG